LLVFTLYIVMALFLTRTVHNSRRNQWLVMAAGSVLVVLIWLSEKLLREAGVMYLLGALYMVVGAYFLLRRKERRTAWLLGGMVVYLMMSDLIVYIARPIASASRQIDSSFWADAVFQLSDYLQVLFQVPQAILMIPYVFLGTVLALRTSGRERLVLATVFLGLGGGLTFVGKPLAMVGGAFIILFAYAVRSLPASVRSGIASLQQIDPAIDEASNSLGADAQYTFRKVTLPLVTPALLAGLIFAFTRHMTSLSAIIFLVSPRWRIVTASILSEWEQGGVSLAAAYATVIIALVLVAIGIMYVITHRVLRGRGDVDLTLGA
jgi:iron(III) transport system permease protein